MLCVWVSCLTQAADVPPHPPLFCRYLLEFTAEALAEYPGLGLEVFGMTSQAWITVRLSTCCVEPFLMSQALSHHAACPKSVTMIIYERHTSP